MTQLKPVHGFPDYVISDDGRVFREFKPDITDDGYYRFTLRDSAGKPKKVTASRAVLSTFKCPPPFDRAEAAHLDGDPSNNRLDNLQWKTHVDNLADRLRHGTLRIGEEHHRSKLSDAQAMEALGMWESGDYSLGYLSKKYEVTKQCIWALKEPGYRLDLYNASKRSR